MAEDIVTNEVARDARMLGRWMLSSLLDGGFVALWVVIQWGVQNVIARFPLSGLDSYLLRAFQWVFAATTLVPILVYICVDVTVMVLRARRLVRKEINKL